MNSNRIGAAASLAASLCLGVQAHAACTVGKVLELPVTLVGGRPVVPVEVNGTRISMLIDSGATYSAIDPALTDALKIKRQPPPFNMRIVGVGGEPNLQGGLIHSMTVGGVDLRNRYLLLLPTGGVEVSGVLGQDLLGVYDVEYDFAHSVVRLLKPSGCGNGSLAYWTGGRPAIEMRIEPPAGGRVTATMGDVYLNGVRIRAQFDTGAQVSTIGLGPAARAGVKPGGEGVSPAGQLYGAGRRPVPAWLAHFDAFKIGGEQIANPRIRIGDLGISQSEMLVGADFFLSHRVYVANSQYKIYMTWDGGPLFGQATHDDPASGLIAMPAAAPAQPSSDVDELLRQGAAAKARRDLEAAAAHFSRAADLAPADPRPFLERAILRLGNRQPALAMSDLDHALKLKPDLLPALVLRARLRLSERDNAGAIVDADAAARLEAPHDDSHLNFGDLYRAVGRYDTSVAEYDAWIAAHPEDSRMVQALFGRCRARAIGGRDLDKALADCNRAVSLAPKLAEILETRAMVRFKRGEYDKAIQDYEAALAVSPKFAEAVYGRGAAEAAKGLAVEGETDLIMARSLQPGIEAQANGFGVVAGSVAGSAQAR